MRIREAEIQDLDRIKSLLLSVNLPFSGVAEHLKEFFILEMDNSLIGTVGMEVYGKNGLLRSLAVEPPFQGRGYGVMLLKHILDRAELRGIREIILLTETAQKFFEKQGFQPISRDRVHDDVKQSVEFTECCPKSALCMYRLL